MIQGANEWIQDIHRNAVDHGWWEQDRPLTEVLALIHSEWSEALEEDRAGRPMVWYDAVTEDDDCGGGGACNAEIEFGICKGKNGKCRKHHKPEGIAVELIDGCIRIMDWFGKTGFAVTMGSIENLGKKGIQEFWHLTISSVPTLVSHLHFFTAHPLTIGALNQNDLYKGSAMYLEKVLEIVFGWLMKRGLDPEAILDEKHRYNVTRPYKHGKQY